jgi:hypothetical protein
MADLQHQTSLFRSWLNIFLMLLLIFVMGFYAFFLVGARGMPDWDYGAVPDVPAESPYADYKLLPHPQHIRGEKGK